MGWLSKLVKGDWSNPFDNIKSGTKNYFETNWNWGRGQLEKMAGIGGAMSGDGWGAIGSAALDFLSSERANEETRQSAEEQMRFQLMMSNTAYQRAMADMASAGLNPMLAYQQGGASTPGGASYKANVPTPGTALQQAATGAAQRTLAGEQTALVKTQKENTIADTTLKQSQALVNATTGDLNRAKALTEGESQAQLRASTAKDVEARNQILETIRLTQQQLQTEIQESARREAQARQAKADADRAEWNSKRIRALNPTADKLVDKAASWLDSLWDTGPTSAREWYEDARERRNATPIPPLMAPRHP